MVRSLPSLALASLLAVCSCSLRVQAAGDPSGHWTGTIRLPDRDLQIEIDLAKTATGAFRATFTGTDVKGLPASNVLVQDTAIRLSLDVNNGGTFQGTLSSDGKSISGDFTTRDGGTTLPFSVSRAGEARIDDPKSAPVEKPFEGTWNGVIDVNGKPMHLAVTLTNHPDGTSTGSVANLDQGSLEIPITTITQQGSTVNLDVKIVNGVYAGTLNAEGTELVGTWTQGPFQAPLIFRRAAGR